VKAFLELDNEIPRPFVKEVTWASVVEVVRELTAVPPFAPVVGTPLRAISVLSWLTPGLDESTKEWERKRAARPADSRTWADRLPDDSPVGVRLRFGAGDVWMMNIGDEMEIYDRQPPCWDDEARRFDLREWDYP